MALFDWLTDGGASALNPMGDATGGNAIAPPPPGMPPVQQTGEDSSLPGNFNFGQMPIRDPGAEGMPAPPAAAGMPSVESGGLPAPPSAASMPAPFAQGTDPMTAGGSPPNGPGLPPSMPAPTATEGHGLRLIQKWAQMANGPAVEAAVPTR